jgi:hypothetical protein
LDVAELDGVASVPGVAAPLTFERHAALEAIGVGPHVAVHGDILADAATVALLEERYAKLADLYARRFLAGEEYPAWALADPEV